MPTESSVGDQPPRREFAIERELELRTTPEDYWDAVTGGQDRSEGRDAVASRPRPEMR